MAGSSSSSASQTQDHDTATFTGLFQRSQRQEERQEHEFISVPQPSSDTATPMLIDDDTAEEEQREKSDQSGRRTEMGEASSSSSLKEKEGSGEEAKGKREKTESNLDGLCCPICMEPWESQGDHQVSCLPCGHVYGLACISRWLQHHVLSAKCPQCNAKCTLKDVRKLYASPVVVFDENLHKKLESLEAEICSLKTERADLLDIQDNLLKVQDNLLEELHKLKEKPACVQNSLFVEMGSIPLRFVMDKEDQDGHSGYPLSSNLGSQRLRHCNFILEHELAVEGARLFDVDTSYQNLILARRISGMGGIHMLNKINLSTPHDNEDIQLPPSTKAVKDLQISSCGRLILLASLGKKLSILSMGSNNVVISYDLKDPAWSCSWDHTSPHHIYTGLQNGMLLVFDMRQSRDPLQFIVGLTPRPIHTIHSLLHNPSLSNTARKLLMVSSLGPCVCDLSTSERPFLVPGLGNEGICTSLAYGSFSDDIVASYRPKFQTSSDNSQASHPKSSAVSGPAVLGSQVLVKRVAGSFYHNLGSTSAYLADVQMAKSAIINMENCFPMFAYGDASTNGLRLRELPSLSVSQNLKPHHQPILDVKYAHTQGTGVLGCVSENKLQLFSAKVL